MAAGRPVVATAVGGVADIVDAGRTGILVPPGDARAFAVAMMRLAESPALRGQMGRNARADMIERFGRDSLVDEMAELYARAVAKRRAPSRGPSPG
jgi:glycosyltransferase involved in cell wall biosynthesis